MKLIAFEKEMKSRLKRPVTVERLYEIISESYKCTFGEYPSIAMLSRVIEVRPSITCKIAQVPFAARLKEGKIWIEQTQCPEGELSTKAVGCRAVNE